MIKKFILLIIIILTLASANIFFLKNRIFKPSEKKHVIVKKDSVDVQLIPIVPKFLYGIQIDSFYVFENTILKNQNLSQILYAYNIPFETIGVLSRSFKKTFDIRKISVGNKYTLLCDKDSSKTVRYFIYEEDAINYILFNLRDSLLISRHQKKVDTLLIKTTGIINSSLYETIINNGESYELVNLLSEIYAWEIDFFRIQQNDKFKVIYQELLVEDRPIGIYKIMAVYFQHMNEDYYAFCFKQDGNDDYFDEYGNSLHKTFLKAPLKYSRISSNYSLNRFHPIQNKWKAHLGTDYAAPIGTPIYSIGDGFVIEAKYKANNGNYVKIKHNGTYTTQYLHMSKIAKGIKPGKSINQGDIIGFVGKSGLATGPHLCFRFWVNGVQVNALKVKTSPSNPVKRENRVLFEQTKTDWKKTLDVINFDSVANKK